MRFLLIAVLLASTCLSTTVAASRKSSLPKAAVSAYSLNPTLPSWVQALEEVPVTTSDEPVVVRLAEVHYWAGARPAFLVNRAVQVNASSRLSEIGQFSIEFAPAYQKVILHRIAIMRGQQVLDRTRTADVRVLDRETGAQRGYYLGESSVQVLLEDVAPGDTLWLTYTVEGRNPVFGSTWSENLPWTKADPVELRKMVVVYSSNQPLHWRVSGMERASLPAPTIEQRGELARMTFKERALTAEQVESRLPPDFVPVPMINLSGYKDWAQVAQWALALFPNASSHPEVKALARKFGGRTDEERASQALHWVQDDIRYFSVSLGENSHRPQPPDVVVRRRFGDCKDKSQLLVALYRAMGLQAQPVLVNATAPKWPAQFLPSPTSFDHAIVRVVLDGKAYFVDPTRSNERGRISLLPSAVPGGAALVIDPATTQLITLPEEVLEVPLVERTEQMIIPAVRGNAQLKVRTEYRGKLAAVMRNAYRSLGSFDLKKVMLEDVERTYPGIKLDAAPSLSDSTEGTAFIVEAQLSIPSPLKEEAGNFALPVRTHILEGTLGIPDKLVRKYPLWLSAGRYRARYNLGVSLPGEARLVRKDDQFALSTKYLEAKAQLTWRGAHLDYYVDYAINNPEVPASELPALEEQVRKLNPLFETKLEFNAVTAAPQTSRETSLRVLDILSKLGEYDDLQAEALRTREIPEIKFDEATYAKLNYRAVCESLLSLYSVRNWNPLLRAPVAALYKAVNSRSDKRSVQLCEARIAFLEHNLPAASKELAALAPADDDQLTLMQAWADFHAGESARAKTNLSRFLKARSLAGELRASDAASGFALARRLGMDEPAEVREAVASLRPGAWPMPLFRLLRKEITAADLLNQVGQLPAAAREHATLEAHFFISQAYLAADEARKADLHVNWLLRFALLGSDYEILANADRYGERFTDPDLLEAAKNKGWFSDRHAVQRQSAAAQRGIALAEYRLANRYLKGEGVSRDVQKGLALLEAAAQKGLSDAMNELGVAYADGKVIAKDPSRAVSYYRQAAEHGNPYAAYNLGHAYWFGKHGLPLDYGQAYRFFREAAEMEDVDAQFFLSRAYFEGKGTEKNDLLARFWAGQSYLRESLDGAAQLGRVLLLSDPDDGMRQIGLRLLEYAAVRQNRFAQFEYGRILLEGIHVPANATAAFRWIEAASRYREGAKALLGRMYVEGLGVKANPAKGFGLLGELVKAGHPDASYQLGLIYWNGASGITDKPKALEYFKRSAEMGERDAAEMAAVMLQAGDGIPRDMSQAERYYRLAVQAGKPRAMNNLAAMFEAGDGVTQNAQRALELYQQAARLGNITAMLNLAMIYEKGEQKARALFVPLAYYMLASRLGMQEANPGLARIKARTDEGTIKKAQDFAASWKPGKAMPEEY